AVNAKAQESPSSGRIVEGRPRLYTFKNDVNPLTWVEWGVEPLFRSAERGWIRRMAGYHPPPDKVAGGKVGLRGTGAGSGVGRGVRLCHKDLLRGGMDIEVPLVYPYLGYELYQANATVPLIQKSFLGKLTFDVQTAYGSRTRDEMFPIGNDAPRRLESRSGR